MKSNKWINIYECAHCDSWLSNGEVFYSDGRCPVCGYKDENAVTIVKCNEFAARWVQTSPWWKFWKVRGNYIKKGFTNEKQ